MALQRGPHPRYQIKALSQQLRKLSFPTSPISVDLARFAADAFERYLAGECQTLDAAFGLSMKLSTVSEGKESPLPLRGTGLRRPRVTDDQRKEFARLKTLGRSFESIRKKMGLSRSSLDRMNAELRAAIGTRNRSSEDVRIRRLLRQLGFDPNDLCTEEQLREIEQMADTQPVARKLLGVIAKLDDRIRLGDDHTANVAARRQRTVPPERRTAYIEGTSEALKKKLR